MAGPPERENYPLTLPSFNVSLDVLTMPPS